MALHAVRVLDRCILCPSRRQACCCEPRHVPAERTLFADLSMPQRARLHEALQGCLRLGRQASVHCSVSAHTQLGDRALQCCQYSKAQPALGSVASPIKTHTLDPGVSHQSLPDASAVLDFTVTAGAPNRIICSGPADQGGEDGRVALLGHPESLHLQYVVEDKEGMACSGEEAREYLESNVHTLEHTLRWDPASAVRCC